MSKKSSTFAADYKRTGMKHVFLSLLCAAIMVPMLTSCNINNPSDPGEENRKDSVGTDEWYIDQITPVDSLQVERTVQNFVGIWAQYAMTTANGGSLSSNYIDEDGTFNPDHFLVMNADKTCKGCRVERSVNPDKVILIKDTTVTWEIEKDSLHFSTYVIGMNPDMEIVALEKDRMILSCYGAEGYYDLFWRVDSLPEADEIWE